MIHNVAQIADISDVKGRQQINHILNFGVKKESGMEYNQKMKYTNQLNANYLIGESDD